MRPEKFLDISLNFTDTENGRTKHFVTMKTYEDVFRPLYDPSYLTKVLVRVRGKKVSPRMVSHVVQTTIGEATVPAEGRGRKRMFSLQDIALIVLGIDLLDLGLPPSRVRTCVSAVRDHWLEVFPSEIVDDFLSKGRWTARGNRCLVAGYYPEGRENRTFGEPLPHSFRVRFHSEKEIPQKVGRYVEGPQIVYAVTVALTLIMASVVAMTMGFEG